MRQLMARRLDRSVLHLPRYLTSELPVVGLRKVRMVSSVTLDADPPALLRHSKHKSPAVLGVQVSVCKDQQALVVG